MLKLAGNVHLLCDNAVRYITAIIINELVRESKKGKQISYFLYFNLFFTFMLKIVRQKILMRFVPDFFCQTLCGNIIICNCVCPVPGWP